MKILGFSVKILYKLSPFAMDIVSFEKIVNACTSSIFILLL